MRQKNIPADFMYKIESYTYNRGGQQPDCSQVTVAPEQTAQHYIEWELYNNKQEEDVYNRRQNISQAYNIMACRTLDNDFYSFHTSNPISDTTRCWDQQ